MAAMTGLFTPTFLIALVTLLFTLGSTQTVDQHVPDDAELFDNIMAATKYDKRVPPKGDNGKPVSVKTSIYVYFLGRFEEDRLEFETQLMIRHRWTDSRLRFRNANISAGQIWFYENIEGEDWFSDKIWTPNIFIENEQSSELTKLLRNNIFVRISRSGDVQMNYRVSAKVLCNMALHRFPHDRQGCSLKLESWTLNANDLILEWERANPLEINDFILPEYALISYNTQQQISCYSETFPSPRFPMMGFSSSRDVFRDTSMCSPTSKNYSRIQVNFVLQRQVGHYFLDYYIPSILLVAMSWVSFWLHPSAVPGRTTLGTATWLTFITLTHNTGTNELPKVSYIKYLDVWFLGCTLFIFTSLLEFAIVNTISRRNESVPMRSYSAKSILQGAATVLRAPTISRRSSLATPTQERRRSVSVSALDLAGDSKIKKLSINEHQLSVQSMDAIYPQGSSLGSKPDWVELSIPVPKTPPGPPSEHDDPNHSLLAYFESMSGEEIAVWIDSKAKIGFPLLFVLFNIAYWIFAFRVDCLISNACGEDDSSYDYL